MPCSGAGTTTLPQPLKPVVVVVVVDGRKRQLVDHVGTAAGLARRNLLVFFLQMDGRLLVSMAMLLAALLMCGGLFCQNILGFCFTLPIKRYKTNC